MYEGIEQMTSRTGRAGANQFIVQSKAGLMFRSYDSNIAFKPVSGKIQLDKNYWNYSTTTGKYRNQFLDESRAETEKKIKSGEYELTELNSN